MRKFIHSDFEIDLSGLGITDNSENPWFTGTFFAKYSYPFEIPLTEEYDIAFGFLSSHNSSRAETLFEGIYVFGDKMEKAILEIESSEVHLSCTMRYGFDEFPNFKKRLAELPLQVLSVGDIYLHAAAVVPQTWPGVNYNFPQIHIDKIETDDSDIWFAFEKIINNYKNGAFLRNTVEDGDIIYNRNIIQPLPYLLHIVQAGIEDAGYTLHGDILSDPELVQTLMYSDLEYYKSLIQDVVPIQVLAADAQPDEINYFDGSGPKTDFQRTFTIPTRGKYKLSGSGRLRKWIQGWQTKLRILYRGNQLLRRVYSFTSDDPFGYADFTFEFTFSTDVDLNPHELVVEINMGYYEPDILLQADLILVANLDSSSLPLPTIYNENKVDLTRAVPEMLFGDLMKIILAMKNMDIDVRDNQIWINYVQKEAATREIINLSRYEVKHPKREYSKGNSYLIKYQDVEYDAFQYLGVFQNMNSVISSDYVKDEKTTEIIINALPLPLLNRNGVNTAHGFVQDKAKPLFVVYNGLSNNQNSTQEPTRLLIPYLHERHYESWFLQIINSTSYTWTFQAYGEQFQKLVNKSRVHAYCNIHLIKALQKKEVKPGLFEVEIETVVLK